MSLNIGVLIFHTSERWWVMVYQIRPERSGQHPVGCVSYVELFSPSPSNMWLHSCFIGDFFLLNVWRLSAVMSRAVVFSCVFGHGLCNTMCPGQNVLTYVVSSLHLLLFFFPLLLSYYIVSTAWAHCASLILVPSVTRQHASLKRQGTVNIPQVH